MAFEGLAEKLQHVFSKLTSRGKLTEVEVKAAMREVKLVLLEADVNFKVVKGFVQRVTERSVGEEVLSSLTPGQQVIKIVRDELVAELGEKHEGVAFAANPPTVVMMCGLQGAGKTTACGKLALLLKKQGKKVLLVACDIYRPAAITQLQVVAKNAGVDVFEKSTQNPVKTAKEAVVHAEKLGYDTVIIDTAGRLQIDELLMKELQNINEAVKPTDILLTVDSMTGQEAVNVAKEFDAKLAVTGVIMTKLDGDTRGGATLSIRAVTGKPIKFCSVGEKLADLEPFYPERMASRILGMGDVLSLIERAQDAVSEETALKLEKKFREASFTLDDYLEQFESMKKMGSMKDILAMMPGVGNKLKGAEIDESRIDRIKAIIRSMTKEERENPDILNASRKKRISKGSGTAIQEINQLLKQFEQTNLMMKQFRGKKKMPFGMGM